MADVTILHAKYLTQNQYSFEMPRKKYREKESFTLTYDEKNRKSQLLPFDQTVKNYSGGLMDRII